MLICYIDAFPNIPPTRYDFLPMTSGITMLMNSVPSLRGFITRFQRFRSKYVGCRHAPCELPAFPQFRDRLGKYIIRFRQLGLLTDTVCPSLYNPSPQPLPSRDLPCIVSIGLSRTSITNNPFVSSQSVWPEKLMLDGYFSSMGVDYGIYRPWLYMMIN